MLNYSNSKFKNDKKSLAKS